MFQLNIATAPKAQAEIPDGIPRLRYVDNNTPFALIMKGGGIKGLAYVGAIDELSKHYKFNWFVGTSAGAITAILLGAGYSSEELLDILRSKNFRDFFDASCYGKYFNLIFHRGFHHAHTFTDWLDSLLAKKLNSHDRVKLGQLPHRVTVYASSRGRRTLKFDSIENKDVDAAYAARCSMSIPFIFTPQAEQGINTFDGGVHQNFPVEQLLKDHPDTPFISLYLGPEIYEPHRPRFVFQDLLSIWTEGADAETISKYKSRTVIIDPRPIRTLDFELSEDEKSYLHACGRAGALSHLRRGGEEHSAAISARDALKARVRNYREWKRKRRRLRRGIIVALFVAIFVATRLWPNVKQGVGIVSAPIAYSLVVGLVAFVVTGSVDQNPRALRWFSKARIKAGVVAMILAWMASLWGFHCARTIQRGSGDPPSPTSGALPVGRASIFLNAFHFSDNSQVVAEVAAGMEPELELEATAFRRDPSNQLRPIAFVGTGVFPNRFSAIIPKPGSDQHPKIGKSLTIAISPTDTYLVLTVTVRVGDSNVMMKDATYNISLWKSDDGSWSPIGNGRMSDSATGTWIGEPQSRNRSFTGQIEYSVTYQR